MNQHELIEGLKKTMELMIPSSVDAQELHSLLSNHINQLIETDFHKLIVLLYRVDVSETKLKDLLEKNTDKDTASIIATLIIERQLQKIKSREQFRKRDNSFDEEEGW